MADTVNISASIRTNLLSLQNTNRLFARTSERLATGLKINSALDGASSFFTARSLLNRANDLAGLKDGIALAIQNLKTADTGIESLISLVEQAKALADQAKEAGTNLTKIAGLAAGSTTAVGTSLVVTAGGLSGVSITNSFKILVSGGTEVTFALSSTTTFATLAAAIDAADSSLTATFNTTTRKIEITAVAGKVLTLTDVSGTAVAGIFGTTQVTTAVAITFGATSSGSTTASLEVDFKKVLDQINLLVKDASFKGVNLINGQDLTVTINETNTTLTITSATLNTTNLGFDLQATTDFTVTADIDKAISQSTEALSTLRKQASSFSTDLGILQTRESFTNSLVSSLKTGAGLLVDANLEEESANLLALQTRQALGTTALAFANQAQQSILSLFR